MPQRPNFSLAMPRPGVKRPSLLRENELAAFPADVMERATAPQQDPAMTDMRVSGDRLAAALAPRNVPTWRRVLAGAASAFGGPQVGQAITGRTQQNQDIATAGAQYNLASEIAKANQQERLGQSLIQQRTDDPILQAMRDRATDERLDRTLQGRADLQDRTLTASADAAAERERTAAERQQAGFAQQSDIVGQQIAAANERTAQQIAASTANTDARIAAQGNQKSKLSSRDSMTAKGKMIAITEARRALQKVKDRYAAIKGSASAGPLQNLPTPEGQAYDAAVNSMRDTVTSITRVPGIGAMSDFETRLQQAKFPTRGMFTYESTLEDQIDSLEQMLNGVEQGYSGLLADSEGGDAPASADPLEGRTATGPSGQKIIRRNGQWVPR